jgi:signal peptidase II
VTEPLTTQEQPGATSKRSRCSKRLFALFIVVAALGLVCDRVTKVVVSALLTAGHAVAFIPGVLDFTLVYNTGAAWGLFDGAFWFFFFVAIAISAVIIVYLVVYPRHTRFEVVMLGLVVAGALGNLYDRLAYGQVTDFIHTLFIEFPVFNVADSCISVGAVGLALFFVFSPQSPFSSSNGNTVARTTSDRVGKR